MSDTPRTDAYAEYLGALPFPGLDNGKLVGWEDFARELERELAKVRSWAQSTWERGHAMGMNANEQALREAYRARDEAVADAAHTNALMTQAMTELETKLEAARKDAERYRVLKPLLDSADFAYGYPPRSVIVFAWNRPVSANLDAMLDDAMEKK